MCRRAKQQSSQAVMQTLNDQKVRMSENIYCLEKGRIPATGVENVVVVGRSFVVLLSTTPSFSQAGQRLGRSDTGLQRDPSMHLRHRHPQGL